MSWRKEQLDVANTNVPGNVIHDSIGIVVGNAEAFHTPKLRLVHRFVAGAPEPSQLFSIGGLMFV